VTYFNARHSEISLEGTYNGPCQDTYVLTKTRIGYPASTNKKEAPLL
jgi:hypothetical protein